MKVKQTIEFEWDDIRELEIASSIICAIREKMTDTDGIALDNGDGFNISYNFLDAMAETLDNLTYRDVVWTIEKE